MRENPSVLSSRGMLWVYRTVPLIASLVVAAASFALSFVALRDVSADRGAVPASLAWLVPIVIDGGVICASAVVWAQAALSRRRTWIPYIVVGVLVALSVVVNAAHAGDDPLGKVIAALPPLVLLATLELVAVSGRMWSEPAAEATAEALDGSESAAAAKSRPGPASNGHKASHNGGGPKRPLRVKAIPAEGFDV